MTTNNQTQNYTYTIDFTYIHDRRNASKGNALAVRRNIGGNHEDLIKYIYVYPHEIKKMVWLLFDTAKKHNVKLKKYKGKLAFIYAPNDETVISYLNDVESKYKKIAMKQYFVVAMTRAGSSWIEILEKGLHYRQKGNRYQIYNKTYKRFESGELHKEYAEVFTNFKKIRFSTKGYGVILSGPFKTLEEAQKSMENIINRVAQFDVK